MKNKNVSQGRKCIRHNLLLVLEFSMYLKLDRSYSPVSWSSLGDSLPRAPFCHHKQATHVHV